MQLGDLIRRLQVDTVAAEELLSLGDDRLLVRVETMAAAFLESPGTYVAAGVGRFALAADDETWLRLVGDIQRSDDPSAAALRRMVLWALEDDARQLEPKGSEAEACGCGAGSCHDAD